MAGEDQGAREVATQTGLCGEVRAGSIGAARIAEAHIEAQRLETDSPRRIRIALQEAARVAGGPETETVELAGDVSRCSLQPRARRVTASQCVGREKTDARKEIGRPDRGSGGFDCGDRSRGGRRGCR